MVQLMRIYGRRSRVKRSRDLENNRNKKTWRQPVSGTTEIYNHV